MQIYLTRNHCLEDTKETNMNMYDRYIFGGKYYSVEKSSIEITLALSKSKRAQAEIQRIWNMRLAL